MRGMMRHMVLAVLAVASMWLSWAGAETVSQRDARKLATTFFNAANRRVMAEPVLAWNGRHLTTNRLFIPFYVYNHPTGGYVIIPADNKAFPILGYSLTESFDAERIPQGMDFLLRMYARDIELIRYDSRIPEEAMAAWQDLPAFIDSILKAPYEATDVILDLQEASESVYTMLDADHEGSQDNFSDLYSDLYLPADWRGMIDEELASRGNVAIGLLGTRDAEWGVIHGHRGPYYRIAFQGRQNRALLRLQATEFLSEGQLAALGRRAPELEEAEEAPFGFFESFVAQTRAEQEARDAEVQSRLEILEPRLRNYGSGKYGIMVPGEVELIRVYNMSGALVRQYRYSGGGGFADVDLMGEPTGFYFAQVMDADGRIYGFKLVR